MPKIAGITLYEGPREPKISIGQLSQARTEITILDKLAEKPLTTAEIIACTGLKQEPIRLALRRLRGVTIKHKDKKWHLMP